MKKYNPQKIEKNWQKEWEKKKLYKTNDDQKKPKYYILDMFPYPSGAGLHVGHPKGYIATDIISRMKKMQGYNVLHPMGWDAFGLPAEQHALKNKIHPRIGTQKNIDTFKKQLEKISLNYDWERESATTDPEFYKWTQWAFIQMFKKGLVFQSNEPINWCPSCKTGLANEDLENGCCERCDTPIEKKKIPQWVIKITDYADRLLSDLDKLDWQEHIKELQRNWIGRSKGAKIKFKISNSEKEIEVFTTRPDTLFGATYMVLAPEHQLMQELKDQIENWEEVEKYTQESQRKTEIERTAEGKEKSGVELKGVTVINPANNEKIPIFIADYVLTDYGTGAIMAVPAHDERDFEFAKKYNLPIKEVIAPTFKSMGKDAVRSDKPMTERRTVDVIIKHWDKDKFFVLDWNKSGNDWYSFVIGGIEKGEYLEEAALREAKEETGYKNMKAVKRIGGEIHSYFYAAHKGVNRAPVKRNCIYIELLDGEWENPAEKHIKNHDGVWIKRSEVADKINFPELKEYWNIFNGRSEELFIGVGELINSGKFDGMDSEEAKKAITEFVGGEMTTSYKLRDWVFSRQRYWGEPIPLIHCEKCGVVPVPEKELPLELPEVESYEPTGTGESPLATIEEWVNTTCLKCSGPAKRETNTMPQWAGSSWYYLRYIDPKNNNVLVDKEKEKYWSPVDFYVGGAEHATRHLIYARFWYKFLYDIGVVNYDEPFKKLQTVGLIMAEDGRKMSKRWGNVINPDDVIEKFGADTLRVYEMFMGPFDQSVIWNTKGLIGIKRFLEKVWRLFQEKKLIECGAGKCGDVPKEIPPLFHKTIKKVTEDIENLNFNTAISQMMIFVNECMKHKILPKSAMERFIVLLAPFAPHISEEIYQNILENSESIFLQQWPKYNEKMIQDKEIDLVIQINGKVRDKIKVSADISEEEANAKALASKKIKKRINQKEIKKIIFIKGKLINIVI